MSTDLPAYLDELPFPRPDLLAFIGWWLRCGAAQARPGPGPQLGEYRGGGETVEEYILRLAVQQGIGIDGAKRLLRDLYREASRRRR